MITENNIQLRALEPNDLAFLYNVENNIEHWQYSDTQIPFSKYLLQQYIDHALKDIYETKQLRLVITTQNTPIGLIDLYQFDPKNNHIGIGIIIDQPKNRGKGYALQSLTLACQYAFEYLHVNQVYAHITQNNTKSIALFEKAGFIITGTKKQWINQQGNYLDQHLYQKLKTKHP